MTTVIPLADFEAEIAAYVDSKDDPEEWYVLAGDHATEYSVWADYEPEEDYQEFQEDLPPEDRDANPPVEGVVQVGTLGWASGLFEDGGSDFVSEYGFGDGKLDTWMVGIIVAHESMLDEEVLEQLEAEAEGEAEATA